MTSLTAIRPAIVQIENRPLWVQNVKSSRPQAKVVLNLHSLTFLGPRHISHGTAKSILKQVDAVTVNSSSLKRRIARRFGLTSSDWNPVVIHPGVDIERYRGKNRTGSATSFSFTRPMEVLFVGRVIRQKGVHVLVEAIRDLHQKRVPVHATIIGATHPWERSYARNLKQRAKGLPIGWVGFVPPHKLPERYQHADVFVCPSQEHEAFGLVNVEAMAAGLPVIASEQGGIREIIRDDCGIRISDYRNPKAFARAIRNLVEHPERLAELRTGALARADKFSWKRAARRFAHLYRDLSTSSP